MVKNKRTTVTIHRATHERLTNAKPHESVSYDALINMALNQAALEEVDD